MFCRGFGCFVRNYCSNLRGKSGLIGILVGTLIGGLTPGSPYAALLLFAVFCMGASLLTGVAIGGLWSIGRIPLEAAELASDLH